MANFVHALYKEALNYRKKAFLLYLHLFFSEGRSPHFREQWVNGFRYFCQITLKLRTIWFSNNIFRYILEIQDSNEKIRHIFRTCPSSVGRFSCFLLFFLSCLSISLRFINQAKEWRSCFMSLNILCSIPVENMKFARAPLQVCPLSCLGMSYKLQEELRAYMEETEECLLLHRFARCFANRL